MLPRTKGTKIMLIRHQNEGFEPCRDGSKTTTLEPLILLGYKAFSDFATFTKNSDNYVEKDLKNGIKVEIAI